MGSRHSIFHGPINSGRPDYAPVPGHGSEKLMFQGHGSQKLTAKKRLKKMAKTAILFSFMAGQFITRASWELKLMSR